MLAFDMIDICQKVTYPADVLSCQQNVAVIFKDNIQNRGTYSCLSHGILMRDEDSVFCHHSMSSHTMIVLAQTTGNAACACLYLQIGALHTVCLQALTYLVSMLLLRHHGATL